MRILVTGGAGYIGSHTVRALLAANHEVAILDDLSTGRRELLHPAAKFIHADLLDTPAVSGALRDQACEAVIHFAARSRVGEDAREPALYHRVNVVGTLSLLDAMVQAGIRRIVFSSTCAVYDAPADASMDERTPRRPVSVYGETKVAMENAVRAYGDAHGWRWTALRYFNAAGAAEDASIGEWHEPETHLIPLALRAASGRGSALTLYGEDYPTPDGTPIRDYIHVEDLAAAHVAALFLEESHAINLGTGHGYSVKDVVAAVERVTGRPVPRSIGPRRPGDPPRLVASAGLAAKLLGWRPRFGLDDMIRTAARWEERLANAASQS